MARARLTRMLTPLLAMALMAVIFAGAGCTLATPANRDWAAPVSGAAATVGDTKIQDTLDSYAAALVAKDRERFLSVIDPGDTAFHNQQTQMFDRVAAVPYSRYQISITSQTQTGPDSVTAKVEIAFTYANSFTDLPDPERAAFALKRSDAGWKISGNATTAALGKPRDAGLEDFGPVRVLENDHVIVLYHTQTTGIATQVAQLTQAAFPRLEAALPGASLPRVTVRVFDNKDQIDRAFPGKWSEWTGGASRPLGAAAGQGGEILIDAATFSDVNGYDPAYNPKMLAHELTHIALFPQSGAKTPPFLVEGLADFVGGEEDVTLLKGMMRRGEQFSPQLKDLYQPGGFSSMLTTQAATLAYEQSDLAVTLLENNYGNEKVLQLLAEFKRRSDESTDQDQLVDEVFRSVLGIGWQDFENEWRRFAVS
ncbi:MAG: gluzincin family metallopeptidase [Thermoleophilia bacterium]